MASTLGNGTITFGDGSTQSSKTPTVVSAFTNDLAYLTGANVASSYATRASTVYRFTSNGAGGSGAIYWYNVDGAYMGGYGWNCNCNC